MEQTMLQNAEMVLAISSPKNCPKTFFKLIPKVPELMYLEIMSLKQGKLGFFLLQ